MYDGLQTADMQKLLDKIDAAVNQLRTMCNTIEGSPENGTELPEAVTAFSQELCRLEADTDAMWKEMFGRSGTVVKKYFQNTPDPHMKTVYDFILINAPGLRDRLR